jgi:hypothetical protein
METTKKTLLDYLLELKELNDKTPQEPTSKLPGELTGMPKIPGFEFTGMPLLGPQLLETDIIQKYLLSLEDFKDVKKINVLKMPTILVDKDTDMPLNTDPDNLGDTTNSKMQLIPTYNYRPSVSDREENKLEFAEEIDLYSIDLGPAIYDPKQLTTISLGPGVWKMPMIYHPDQFVPINEIKIIYSAEGLQDILFDKTKEEIDQILEERIIKQVRETLKGGKINVPEKRSILIRATKRSFKQSVEQK